MLQFGEKLAKGAGNFNSPAEKTGKHLVYAKMLITEPKNISVCNSALCLLQMRPWVMRCFIIVRDLLNGRKEKKLPTFKSTCFLYSPKTPERGTKSRIGGFSLQFHLELESWGKWILTCKCAKITQNCSNMSRSDRWEGKLFSWSSTIAYCSTTRSWWWWRASSPIEEPKGSARKVLETYVY